MKPIIIPRMLRRVAGRIPVRDPGASRRRCLLIVVLATVSHLDCGSPVGSSCRTEGSGFTAKSPCRSQCLDVRVILCPGGERVSPPVCAGEKDCTLGGCPADQACYHFDDPFEVQAYCIPTSVCPDLGTMELRSAWERAAEQRAEEARARYRGHGAPTVPTTPN